MRAESTALLSPPQKDLPSLFEVARILGRCIEPSDALEAILALLESSSGSPHELTSGLAAALEPEGKGLSFVAASERADAPLLGATLGMGGTTGEGGSGLAAAMSRCLERGVALAEQGCFAAPALAGGKVVAVIGFRRAGAPGAAPLPEGAQARDEVRGLVEACLALYAEAWSLRAGLAEKWQGMQLREAGPQGRGKGGHQGGSASAFPGDAPIAADGEPDSPGPSAAGRDALAALVGNSPAMAEAKALILRVAPTDSTVLITGESGTGKELAARALHALSARAEGPFVAVNCAALPESLLESELFGHEKGAFTGAQARRLGRFELAMGGTIFLDEVAELAAPLQAKLLRVLQERSFERVGGTRTIRAELRVIAATNRDLEAAVASGSFRADLYWRLAVFPMKMPALRERGADLVLLADLFTEKYSARLRRQVTRISTPALDLLTSYHWPGNVRELENVIERAVILSSDGVIHAYHLPPSLQSAESTGTGPASTLDASLARLERELLVEALKMEGGNAAAAARRLGVTERRMGLALKRYGIDWRRFRRGISSPSSAPLAGDE
jgi:DNA-binding NtrC family response regulator